MPSYTGGFEEGTAAAAFPSGASQHRARAETSGVLRKELPAPVKGFSASCASVSLVQAESLKCCPALQAPENILEAASCM